MRDEVVWTDPVAGEELEEGEVLEVYVSLGEPNVVVPNLVGLSVEDARIRLEGDGLELGAVHERSDEEAPNGFVLEVLMGLGVTEVEPGAAIDVVVSSGPEDRRVPEVTEGMTEPDAVLLLDGRRLAAFSVLEYHETVPAGEVIRFEPSSGALVEADATVTIVVSQGPEPREVPEVIGLDVEEATALLTEAGFIVSGVQGDPSRPVLATDPPAGEIHDKGTLVVIATQLSAG